jgi:hypothetical protein
MAKYKAAKPKSVTAALPVFRFVSTDSMDRATLADEFLSEREAGKAPDGRERKAPLLQEGRSSWRTLEHARRRWKRMCENAERGGDTSVGQGFVAEAILEPGEDFQVEDLGKPDGHLTIWGDRTKLAEAVRAIHAADDTAE